MTTNDRGALWPLAGRDEELAALWTAWGSGRWRGLVVHGAAGVGKSRVARECFDRAVRSGSAGGRAAASAATALVPLGATAHLLPAGTDLSDPVRGFARVAAVLAGSGREHVMMIDDLHWLDAASAVLLGRLLDAGSIRLIGTVRSGEPANNAVQALCADGAMFRMDLAAFGARQVEQVVRAALDGPVGRQTVRRLRDSSGGNALYLRELVSGALAAGTLTSDGEIWELAEGRTASTPRLVELIGARLATAPDAARPVLDLLALCEPVPLADAEAVAEMDVLVALESAGLIRAQWERGEATIALAHPLYAEVLRADIPTLRRRKVLLDQVERALAGGVREADKRRMAAWQLEFTGAAEPALLIEAAALARYAHDYAQARNLLQALSAEDHTTATLMMLGEVLWELGESARSDAVLAKAAHLAADDHEFLGVTLARALNRCWGVGDYDGTFDLLESAGRYLTSPDCLKSLRHTEGAMRVILGEPHRGLALLADMADDVDPLHAAAWLNAVMMKSVGLTCAGRTADALACATHAYQVHLVIHDQVLFPDPDTQLISAVLALTHAGRLSEGREVAEAAITRLARTRTSTVQVWMTLHLANLELVAGHIADARRWFAEAAAAARALRYISAMNPALVGLAMSAALLGDVEAAEQASAEAGTHPILRTHSHWSTLSSVWIHTAHRKAPHELRQLLADTAELAGKNGLPHSAALLLIDAARLGGAAQAAPRLAEIAESFDGALLPALAHFAAALAADEPARLLTAAGELAAVGADLMAAEAACAASAGYARSADPRKATAAAQDAQRHLDRCGERPRTPLLQVSRTTAPLTGREREIVVLAAHGTPSREIAETLRLSVRTVDNHLHRAYTKLGVTSRSELRRALSSDF